MRRCLTSSAIKQMQIKTTRCYFVPISMAKIKKAITTIDEDVKEPESLYVPGRTIKLLATLENNEGVNFIIILLLSNSILGHISKRTESSTLPHKNLYTNDYNSIIHNSQKVGGNPQIPIN